MGSPETSLLGSFPPPKFTLVRNNEEQEGHSGGLEQLLSLWSTGKVFSSSGPKGSNQEAVETTFPMELPLKVTQNLNPCKILQLTYYREKPRVLILPVGCPGSLQVADAHHLSGSCLMTRKRTLRKIPKLLSLRQVGKTKAIINAWKGAHTSTLESFSGWSQVRVLASSPWLSAAHSHLTPRARRQLFPTFGHHQTRSQEQRSCKCLLLGKV